MKSRILKRILTGLLVILIIFGLLFFTPGIWSALYPEKAPVGYHLIAFDYLAVLAGLEELVNRTPPVPDDIEELKDIEYKKINDKSLQLDLYKQKNNRGEAPLLVFIHGGGWKSGQRSDYMVYLLAFAGKGYVTATVSYRLLDDGPYPACAEDITDAVNWFFNHGSEYGYDPDRIALIGGSAGAHLALLAAYGWGNSPSNNYGGVDSVTGRRIKAVVDIYGPVDLTTRYARNHPLVTSFISRPYVDAPELYRQASPIEYLDKSDPPTLILHGTSDELVPISQSDILKAKMDSLGIPCVYYRLPLWPHTMDVVKRVNEFCQLKMNMFFEEYLK